MSYTRLKTRHTRSAPTDKYLGDQLRISFPRVKADNSVRLNIEFGQDLARRIGVVPGERLGINLMTDNPLIWVLKKDTDPHYSWKVVETRPGMKNTPYTLRKTWFRDIPGRCDSRLRFTTVDIFDGGLRVKLPGYDDPALVEKALREQDKLDHEGKGDQ